MPPRPDMSIVIPVLNERDNLEPLCAKLLAVIDKIGAAGELIFVDDGSRDGSREWLRKKQKTDSRIKVLFLSRNFGHQIALSAGLDAAEGRAVVAIDADLQDPPEFIEDLYRKWQEGFDVVFAVRRKREGETHWKKMTAALFYRALGFLSRVEIPRDTGDFRLMDRQVVLAYRNLREQTRFIRGLIAWLGFRQIGIEYDRKPRHKGKSKYSLRKMVRLGIDGILSFSGIPLRISMYCGMLVGLCGVAYTAFLIIQRLLGIQPIPGWTSTMVAVILTGSLNLIFLGIIGEYLSRVYNEVRQRPLYVVQERLGRDREGEPEFSRQDLHFSDTSPESDASDRVSEGSIPASDPLDKSKP